MCIFVANYDIMHKLHQQYELYTFEKMVNAKKMLTTGF